MEIQLWPLPDPGALERQRQLRVTDVLALGAFAGARAIGGLAGLQRHVTHVHVMQVPSARIARTGDLVLAADEAFRRSPDPGELLGEFDDHGVAGVAARTGALDDLRPELVAAADERGIVLIELPASVHLSELLNGTLEALVASQATRLRQRAAVREQLGGFVLAGGDLESLPEAVAEITGGEVVIIGVDREVLAASTGCDRERARAVASRWYRSHSEAPAVADDDWVVWPIAAGVVQLGCLVANLSGPPDAVRLAALEYGSNSAALEILHRREAVDADARLREGFVRDLLSGSLIKEARSRRTTALGWDAGERYVVLLARGDRTSTTILTQRAHGASPTSVAIARRGACLVVVPVRGGDSDVSALASLLTDTAADVHVGISGELAAASDLPAGLRAADEALRAAEAFPGPTRSRARPALGSLGLLSEVPAHELRAFADDVLAPLDAAEPTVDGPLRATLGTLVATGLNIAETARRGGWHYNTVRYRLRKLEEVLGPFMENGALLQTLSLALLLRRELATLQPQPDGTSRHTV